MLVVQAHQQAAKSNSFSPPAQSSWSPVQQPRPLVQQWQQPLLAMPGRVAAPGQTQVMRTGVVSPRPTRQASTSPRPCYSWRSRALEPVGLPQTLLNRGAVTGHGTAPVSSSRTAAASRGRQPSSGRRSYRTVTRARTPPLETLKRNRQKVENAEQTRAAVEFDAGQSSAGEGRYDRYLEPRGVSAPVQQQPPPSLLQHPCGLQHRQNQVQQASANAPRSPVIPSRHIAAGFASASVDGAGPAALSGSASFTAVSPNDEASQGISPSTVPQVPSDASSPNAETGPPPPSSWSNHEVGVHGVLMEYDANSPQGWRRPHDKNAKSLAADGQENDPLSRQQLKPAGLAHMTQWEEPASSGSSGPSPGSLKYTDGGSPNASSVISFNMSPILQAPKTAAAGSQGSEGAASSTASRRESLEATGQEQTVISPSRSKSLDVQRFCREDQALDGTFASSSTAGRKPCTDRTSKVAEKICLWENISAANARKGRSLAGAHGSAWSRCLSDMARSRREQEKDDSQMRRLIQRVREVDGCDDLPSPSSSSSGSEPSSPSQDAADSPNTQKIKTVVEETKRQLKSMKKTQDVILQAFLRVVSLDSVFARESQPAASSTSAGPRQCVTVSECAAGVVSSVAAKPVVEGRPSACSSRPQPEEEEVSEESSQLPPLPQVSRPKSGDRKSDGKVVDDDTTACHSEMDSSRNSHSTGLPDDPEPAREPQPRESLRHSAPGWMRADLKCISDELKKQKEEDDEHADAQLNTAEPSLASEPLAESADGHEAEARHGEDYDEETVNNTSVNSSTAGLEREESSDDSFSAADRPQACQEGMPRVDTILHALEQHELHRSIVLVVPQGMDSSRQVSFQYEDQMMRVTIPDGYDVGQQVAIHVPTGKRPPLERNAIQAWHRGHQNYPDRHCVMEPLRHCCRITSGVSLDHPEYKQRYQMYGMLQGKSMTPLLPEMPEGDEEEQESEPDMVQVL